jgi:hypothetical protein
MRYWIVLGSVLLAVQVFADPIEWPVEQGGNGHFYELVVNSLTWYEAEAAAASRTWAGAQGYLAVITSSEEHAWVWAALGQPFLAYLGGVQLQQSDPADVGWSWVTGEPWEFTNWGPNEPNDAGTGNEWVLHFGPGGLWNDTDGGHPNQLGMVVEYEYGAVSSESSTWGGVKALYGY